MSKSNTHELNIYNIFSLKSLLLKILGVSCTVIAIKGFMIPNHFLDGGLIGISVLIHEFYLVEVSIPLIILNLPFVYIGYKKVGKNFAFHTLLSLVFLGLLFRWLPVYAVTEDHFLVAVFGGVFVGLGIGFVIRSGGVIDGLEVIAEYTNKQFGLSTTEIIMAINTTIFLFIAFFLGIEKAMYSIITFFTALKVSDYVVDGFEKLISLTIISPNDELIKDLVVNKFNKPITVYKGERGHLPGSYDIKHDCEIVVTIVTRLEVHKVKKAIAEADPLAFMYIENIKEVDGGVFSRKSGH